MDKNFELEFRDGKKTLVSYHGNASHVIIPDDVEEIGEKAFGRGDYLKKIEIPESVQKISAYAFGLCTNLVSVKIQEGLKEIDEYAFTLCYSLSSAQLPESIKIVGGWVFNGCIRLRSLVIPQGVEEFGETPFPVNTVLALPLNYRQSENKYQAFAQHKCLIHLIQLEQGLIAKLYLTGDEIEAEFFKKLIGGHVEHISEYDSLFPIRDEIMINKIRVALYRLEYPFELSEEHQLIYSVYLRNHADLIIPLLISNADIQMINRLALIGAFPERKMNEYIDLAQDLSLVEIVSFLLDYKFKAFGIDSQKSLEIQGKPSEDWETLENLDGTLTIKKYLGKDQHVDIPPMLNGKHVSRIEGALWSLKISIFFPENDHIKSVKIAEGIQEIGDRAFLECTELEEIVIPDSVKIIGNEAFRSCHNLKQIIIPDGVTEIKSFAFCGCSNLASITIPEGLEEIEKATFFGCGNLTSYIIPGGVKKIGDNAFGGCNNLASITIPEDVMKIGKAAFDGCGHLVIHAPEGSYAARFAHDNNIQYSLL
jgi:hypothetical protein